MGIILDFVGIKHGQSKWSFLAVTLHLVFCNYLVLLHICSTEFANDLCSCIYILELLCVIAHKIVKSDFFFVTFLPNYT